MIYVNKVYFVVSRDFRIYVYLLEYSKELQIQNEATYWSELFFSRDSVLYL